MDSFETPYEDTVEINYIQCEICNKSIRGDTLYQIHVTTHGHLKNEDALVAEGKIVREHVVPEFEDLLQFLDYLNLDEPIVGLEFLEEIPNESAETPGLKYTCMLCMVNAYLPDTVSHLIGRKHRQKYLEKLRPDLATWDPLRSQSLSGKLLRAKAEIAARQTGRGTPKPLPHKAKMHLFSRFQGGQNNGQSSRFPQDLGPPLSKFRPPGSGRYFSDNPDYSADSFDLLTDNFGYDRPRPQRGEGEMFGYRGEGFGGVPGPYDEDRRPIPDDFRKPPPPKDPLKEFYTEELKREQIAKAQLPPPVPRFGDEPKQWRHDMEPPQHRDVRLGREADFEAGRGGFPTSLDPKNSQEIFRMIKDYRHNVLGSGMREEAVSGPGPSRISPSRSGDLSRKMSEIPDPFMRFLQGGKNRDEPVGKKRKSRFTDATVEEVQAAQEAFGDEPGPTKPKFPSMRPEIRDHPPQQAQPHKGLEQKERFQREPLPQKSEGTGNVFEMLSSIQIENEEEANFLKEKLCTVLREFKAWKMEKMAQTSQVRAVFVKEYNNRPATEQRKQEDYDRIPRDNPDLGRRAEDPYNDPRQSELEEHEPMMDEGFPDYQRPPFPESRRPTMNTFREPKMWPMGKSPARPPVFDKPTHFHEKFQDPLQPRDYESADDFDDYQSSRPHLPMEQGPRMQRPPQYSRNLDKITSTLLELVARK